MRKRSHDSVSADEMEAMWARHNAEWRDTAQIASQWKEAGDIDLRLLETKTKGAFFEAVKKAGVTLLVTREYEHLIMAVSAKAKGKPRLSYLPMPHPSGIAVDRENERVFVASTRNPNQILEMRPLSGFLERLDAEKPADYRSTLMTVRSRHLPGCLYMHDLAIVGGELLANAVGHNAVVRLSFDNGYERVWWPKCIETKSGPVFGQNHIQLNSIAPGATIAQSFFSASGEVISSRRPGHQNYPVDGRGVIFSGATREPVARGLTRPHSARLHQGGLWVDNSGYGELCLIEGGKPEPVITLPGWTRGLAFAQGIAFVGTSRVIPRFRQYAPGLDVDRSVCGIHAVDIKQGRLLGSLIWPYGNQIFAVDCVPETMTMGFPFVEGRRESAERLLFYAFDVGSPQKVKRVPSARQSTKRHGSARR